MSGDGSHEVSRPDTVHDQYRSNESPKLGDALSISSVPGRDKLYFSKLYFNMNT